MVSGRRPETHLVMMVLASHWNCLRARNSTTAVGSNTVQDLVDHGLVDEWLPRPMVKRRHRETKSSFAGADMSMVTPLQKRGYGWSTA